VTQWLESTLNSAVGDPSLWRSCGYISRVSATWRPKQEVGAFLPRFCRLSCAAHAASPAPAQHAPASERHAPSVHLPRPAFAHTIIRLGTIHLTHPRPLPALPALWRPPQRLIFAGASATSTTEAVLQPSPSHPIERQLQQSNRERCSTAVDSTRCIRPLQASPLLLRLLLSSLVSNH